jgi:AraC-like DNA-binding protein
MVRNARAAEYESCPQAVIAVGNTYAAGHVHPAHSHARSQLLYSSTGVMIVGTEQGSWVVPPQRAIWIPAGVRHDIRMVGEVSTRSLYLKDGVVANAPDRCRVIAVSPLLRRLLIEAIDLPIAYETDTRANHIIQLVLLELKSFVELPMCVPIPAHARLATQCRAFMAAPGTHETIDDWATSLHMSRRAFTRLFRSETGMSLSAWRQQACAVAALPRLISGEPVTSVAFDLGYGSPAAFSAMFRRVMGTTPVSYLADGG